MTYNVFSGTLNPTHFTSLLSKSCRRYTNFSNKLNAAKFVYKQWAQPLRKCQIVPLPATGSRGVEKGIGYRHRLSKLTRPYTLDCEASSHDLGAVLSQEKSGIEKVIAYSSRTMSKPELRYDTTRKELLAIVNGLKQFASI